MLFPEEHTISQGKPRLTLNGINSYVSLVFKTETQEEVRKTEEDRHHIMLHMWNLKHATNESIYGVETERTDLLPRGRGLGERWSWRWGLADVSF